MSTSNTGDTAPGGESSFDVREPEFPAMKNATSVAEGPDVNTLQLLYDVNVTVSAELGRAVLPIGDLLKLGAGSVVELDRQLSEPVDLIAQGVLIARGEVVVVDDCFAIRIKEIESPKRKTGEAA